MTNRDLIIKQLQENNDDVLVNFMCPYIPNEEGSECDGNTDTAEYNTHCKGCIRKWLDSEALDAE